MILQGGGLLNERTGNTLDKSGGEVGDSDEDLHLE